MKPKEIVKDINTGVEYASFSYYDGINVAEERNYPQTTNFAKLDEGNCFIVCCGYVMMKITSEDFPDVKRKILE